MKTELIKAIHPADLLEQVSDAIKAGKDLMTQTFVSQEGLICQWMVPSMCLYDYKLIVATDLDVLEKQAGNLIELGYDFLFTTVMWEGMYLQWMHRMNGSGLSVRDAVEELSVETAARIFIDEDRGHVHMVADARPSVQLANGANGEHVVAIPYPVS